MRETRFKSEPLKVARIMKGLTIISAILFFGALFCVPMVDRRARSTGWPTTEGVIVATGLKKYSHKPPREPFFEPTVCYSYTADGISCIGSRISFADSKPVFARDEALAWLSRHYPEGKRVKVYYDPSEPDLAVLVPGAEDLVFILVLYLGTTAFFGLFSFFYGRAKLKAAAADATAKIL